MVNIQDRINYNRVIILTISIFLIIFIAVFINYNKPTPIPKEKFMENVIINIHEEKNYDLTLNYMTSKLNYNGSYLYIYNIENNDLIFESKTKFQENKFVISAIKTNITLTNNIIKIADNARLDRYTFLSKYYYSLNIPFLNKYGTVKKDSICFDPVIDTREIYNNDKLKNKLYAQYISDFDSLRTNDSITFLNTPMSLFQSIIGLLISALIPSCLIEVIIIKIGFIYKKRTESKRMHEEVKK